MVMALSRRANECVGPVVSVYARLCESPRGSLRASTAVWLKFVPTEFARTTSAVRHAGLNTSGSSNGRRCGAVLSAKGE